MSATSLSLTPVGGATTLYPSFSMAADPSAKVPAAQRRPVSKSLGTDPPIEADHVTATGR